MIFISTLVSQLSLQYGMILCIFLNTEEIRIVYAWHCGPDSSVGIATGWTARGSNPGGVEIFRTCPDRSWGPPSFCTMGTGSFPGVKSGRGVTLTPHPLLVPWSRNGRAIPLLPVWAVWPIQSLSVCTRVHFIFTFTFTRDIYLAGRFLQSWNEVSYRQTKTNYYLGQHNSTSYLLTNY
jgi:hypothetical protein